MAVITANQTTREKSRGSFRSRRGRDLALNLGLLAVLWLLYNAVRGVTADDLSTAMSNALDLLHLQNFLGLPSEQSLQQGFAQRTGVLRAANVYYVAIHFPLTIAFMAWVWTNHRDRFNRIRNTMIGVTLAGLVLHIVYPLAPPRMISGFMDTAATIGPNPYDLKIAAAANQIAAMPSLHVGWALLVSVGLIWITRTTWSYLALAHPVITTAVVVITANHYWTDAIVAAALVGLGWMIFAGSPPKPAEIKAGALQDLD